jgi:hypothetical protein
MRSYFMLRFIFLISMYYVVVIEKFSFFILKLWSGKGSQVNLWIRLAYEQFWISQVNQWTLMLQDF